MPKFQLIGGSYESQSPNVSVERTVNWYPEIVEAEETKSKLVLYPTPGLAVFATLPESPVRGELFFNGRMFAIGGTKFCEVLANGTVNVIGTVITDGLKAYIAAGATMLSIASAGHLYAFILDSNTFSEIDTTTGAALQGPVSQVFYSDGYYIAILQNSDKFQLSGLLDATSWDPLDIGQVSVFPDNIVGATVDHRELWLMGSKASQPYSNTGNSLFPYEVIPGAYIEQGLIAQDSVAKLDNSIFGLGGDERGAGVAWRAQGYVPQRISNHAVEYQWSTYPTITDAVGWAYQDQGHTNYVLWFPSANKTWVFDAATRMWHERTSFINGVEGAWLPRCHAYAFGLHLVGDRNSGNIYRMDISLFTDAGQPIRRVRRSPHLCSEQKRIRFDFLQVDLETGLGPIPALQDGNGADREPQLVVRWSDDGGHTWSNEYSLGCGFGGKFKTRVIRRRMGISRDRVYEISCSDPIPWRVVEAYLETS